MADLVLTQMDREAAADLYCDWFSVSEANDSVKKLRAGKWDGLLVQAFAKHRLAEREAIERWLRAEAMSCRETQRGYDPLSHGHILFGDLDRRLHAAADAISRGDHLKEGNADG